MRRLRVISAYLSALLLTSTAVLSCSAGAYDMMASPDAEMPRSILISGAVSDQSGNTLEDIAVTFQAYPIDDSSASPLFSVTEYTNSLGVYTLRCAGIDTPVRCIIAANDQKQAYQSQINEVIVSWTGDAFDQETNTFVVNNCNFILARR